MPTPPTGETGSAVIINLIQTALENGLDPWCYLIWLLQTVSAMNLSGAEKLLRLLSSCKFCDEIAVFHEDVVIQQDDVGGKYHAL